MAEQDSSIMTAPAGEVVETSDGPSREWFETHRTTPEEHASAIWAEDRNRDIAASRTLKQALGQDYDAYRGQLESLSSDERADLSDKSAEEIAAHLDARAEADRDLKNLEKQAKEQAAEHFEPTETPHLREVRKAMKTAYREAASLDERIAELQQLNELRNDPSAEGWDDLPAEAWRSARERTMEGFEADISNLIQERQAKLQEAALHQNAYHEEARSTQAHSVPNRPIGQITGANGQTMQVTRADIATIVQLERDDQAHQQRTVEGHKRYPDWREAVQSASRAGVDVTSQQMAFIKTLPNSADVAYYLTKNHSETRAIARMDNTNAWRALMNISHQLARGGAPIEKKTTKAPKPPAPVGGSSSRAFDVSDESTSADEWFRRRNADLKRRSKY
jgi:hypothetical protein